MAKFILHDHAGYILYYDIQNESIVKGSGYYPSPQIVPIFYSQSTLYIFYNGEKQNLKAYTSHSEEIIGGIEKISISKDNFFGAAEPGSPAIVFSRKKVAGWELFRCSEIFFENPLSTLTRATWLSLHDGTLHDKTAITSHDNGFFISDRYYDRLENNKALEALSLHDESVVLMRGMSAERYVRYTPLIYFVAFGSDEQRESVITSILSLVEIGQYRGDFCIITDRDDMHSILPDNFPGKLHIFRASAHSRIEMWKARYRIGELFQIGRYQPILYMDTDVICNAPINTLLRAVLMSPQISVGTEDQPDVVIIPSRYRESEAVGKAFFEHENFFPNKIYGFNSGIIGFPNINVAQAAFNTVIAIIDRMICLGNTKGWVDQAVLNYVLHKQACVDDTSISSMIAVGTGEGVFPYKNATQDPVLIHFWSTHAHDRLPRLKRYLQMRIEQLNKSQDTADLPEIL